MQLFDDLKIFSKEFSQYCFDALHLHFTRLESKKSTFVTALYRQRGKMASKLIHSGMAGLAAVGVIIAPVIAQEFPGLAGKNANPWDISSPSSVLSASTGDPEVSTSISEKGRDQIIDYTVAPGDTLSSIASKFGISTDTIRWQNDLASKDSIKDGQVLQILPVDGVAYKVQKGDTIYSIAKKYQADAQAIADFPFNTFVNDETFEIAVGQTLIVPDGIVKDDTQTQPTIKIKQITPDAGTVVASGRFVWPTQGVITQRFSWYHPGIDIANPAAPQVVAADSGKVIFSGWTNDGYGYHVIIDHGNGYKTLYAHLQKLYVTAGQSVGRGSAIGQMGSTGRSTGTHTHFEVILNGVRIKPLSVLK